jgi:Predicted hydrolase of the alpha/beta superfamily
MQFLRILTFIICFAICSKASGQYKVHIIVDQQPSYTILSDSIFIAGSFNGWNPHDKRAAFSTKTKDGITLELGGGTTEFKFTRGSWQAGEADKNGKPTSNRKINVTNDTTIHVEIKNWADHFKSEEKKSTANKNVHVLSNEFYIPQLDRKRRIWIYLPASYQHSKKTYPVMYMQDGQNVFDDATSFSGEWGVDDALDTLEKETRECIVVAIDNGGDKRINEYCPYDMEKFGKGEGAQYVDFLVQTLKPHVDAHFRTKRDREHTYIAGSSMGGLISMYAILKYPNVFGGAGIFSPAFWVGPKIKEDASKRGSKVKGKIFFYAGKEEGESMVPDMLEVFEILHRNSSAKMETVIRNDGKHSEANWRREFPIFYRWLVR